MTDTGMSARTWQRYSWWLIVNRRGEARLNKTCPTPSHGEYVFLVEFSVPSNRIPVPLGTIKLSLPEPGSGEVELLVSDTPIDQGGPKPHLYEVAQLNQYACSLCGFSTRTTAHQCAAPDCSRMATVEDARGVLFCPQHEHGADPVAEDLTP